MKFCTGVQRSTMVIPSPAGNPGNKLMDITDIPNKLLDTAAYVFDKSDFYQGTAKAGKCLFGTNGELRVNLTEDGSLVDKYNADSYELQSEELFGIITKGLRQCRVS